MVDHTSQPGASQADSSQDRRSHARVATDKVRSLLGQVVDLSPGGMCVMHEGRWPFEVNDAFDVVLWQGQYELLLSVRVAWVKPMGSGGHRLGLEFVSQGPQLEKVIAELTKSGCGEVVGPQAWYAA
jgi:hypothetical protein